MTVNGKEQPCWTCKKATGGCNWSNRLEPVEGWEAKRVRREMWRKDMENYGYEIIRCPEYEKDEEEERSGRRIY